MDIERSEAWDIMGQLAKNHINIAGVVYQGTEPVAVQFEYQWRFTSRAGVKGTRVSRLSVPFYQYQPQGNRDALGEYFLQAVADTPRGEMAYWDYQYVLNYTAILYMVRATRAQIEQ